MFKLKALNNYCAKFKKVLIFILLLDYFRRSITQLKGRRKNILSPAAMTQLYATRNENLYCQLKGFSTLNFLIKNIPLKFMCLKYTNHMGQMKSLTV